MARSRARSATAMPAPGMPVPVTVVAGAKDEDQRGTARCAGRGRWALRRCASWWSIPTCSAPTATAATGGCWPGRAVWRGIPVELIHAGSDAPLPEGADLYCLGGARTVRRRRRPSGCADGALAAAVDAGAVALAVCAGYQVIGRSRSRAPTGGPTPGWGSWT